MKSLGERLRQHRVKMGLSITDCAKAAEVSPSTYREWEYGRSIKGEPYEKLANVLEMSLSELLTGKTPNWLKDLEDVEVALTKVLDHIKTTRIQS